MSDPYLFVPIFSWPAAPGGLLFTYFAGGTVFAPTYAASGAINTNPVVLDANGSAAIRRDPDISYHFVLKDSTGQTTLWDADSFPADAIFGAPTTIAAGATVDLGTAVAHSALIHGAGATITSFGVSANAGTPFYVATFDGVNTLINSSTLVLPGAANITTAAGDAILAFFNGTGWNVLFYQQGFVSGLPTGGGGGSIPTDIVALKTSNQSITNTGTLFADGGLVTSSLPVGSYEYELLLNFYSNNATNGGFAMALKQNGVVLKNYPTFIAYNVNGSGAVAATTSNTGVEQFYNTISAGAPILIYDTLYIRGTFQVSVPGPLQLWWSQTNSSSGNATLMANSMLRVGSA